MVTRNDLINSIIQTAVSIRQTLTEAELEEMVSPVNGPLATVDNTLGELLDDLIEQAS